ncbi:MAG: glutaredoxin family protein [Vicinamibacterales bacterium]
MAEVAEVVEVNVRASLLLYSRPGCHLCDEMKAVVDRIGRSIPLDLQVVDISGDPELERLYGLEIPVLLVNGRKVAKYRIEPDALRRALAVV